MFGHRPVGMDDLRLAHDLPARQLLVLHQGRPSGSGRWGTGRRQRKKRPPQTPIGSAGHRLKRNLARKPVDWLFRNRDTGQITIAQFPNAALGLFLAATGLQWVLDPAGGLRTGLRLLATAGLIWWAADELIRGVNPWRRLLGGAVLAAQLARYLT